MRRVAIAPSGTEIGRHWLVDIDQPLVGAHADEQGDEAPLSRGDILTQDAARLLSVDEPCAEALRNLVVRQGPAVLGDDPAILGDQEAGRLLGADKVDDFGERRRVPGGLRR